MVSEFPKPRQATTTGTDVPARGASSRPSSPDSVRRTTSHLRLRAPAPPSSASRLDEFAGLEALDRAELDEDEPSRPSVVRAEESVRAVS
jgi:hypothetical protein